MGGCQSKSSANKSEDISHELLPDDEGDIRLADKYLKQVEKRNQVLVTSSAMKEVKKGHSNLEIENASNHQLPNDVVSTLRSRAAMLEKAEEDAAMMHPTSTNQNSYILQNSSSGNGHSAISPSNISVVSGFSTTISHKSGSRSVSSTGIMAPSTPMRPLQPPKYDTTPLNTGTSVTTSTSSSSGGGVPVHPNGHSNPTSMTLSYHRDFVEDHDEDDHHSVDADASRSLPLHSFTEHCEIPIAQQKVTAIATVWCPHERQSCLAVGTDKGKIFVFWDATAGGKSMLQLPTRQGKIRCLDFSIHNGNPPFGGSDVNDDDVIKTPLLNLAVGGDDCTVVVYEIFSGGDGFDKYTSNVVGDLEREDRIYALEYSPETNQYLAMGGFDGMITIARNNLVNSSTQVFSAPLTIVAEVIRSGLVLCLSWHASETYLAVGGSDGTLAVLECNGKDDNWELAAEVERGANILCLAWTSELQTDLDSFDVSTSTAHKDMLAIGTSDGFVALMDTYTKKLIKEIALSPTPIITATSSILSNSSTSSANYTVLSDDRALLRVNCLRWSPDGSYLAIGGANGLVLIVDTSTLSVLHEVARPASITSVRWLENDEHNFLYLVAGGEEERVTLFQCSPPENHRQQSKHFMPSPESPYRSSSRWILKSDFRDAAPSQMPVSQHSGSS